MSPLDLARRRPSLDLGDQQARRVSADVDDRDAHGADFVTSCDGAEDFVHGAIGSRRSKPRLRGVSTSGRSSFRSWAASVLVLVAPPGRATFATAIYAASVAALFGVSALYHRITWASASARRWMRRLDHTMIFFLIAGTYTPFALLVLDGTLAAAILVAVWGGALAGVVLNLVWIDSPKWVTALVYVALGWVAVIAFPDLISELGVMAHRAARRGRRPLHARRGRLCAARSRTRRRPCSATTRSSTCS